MGKYYNKGPSGWPRTGDQRGGLFNWFMSHTVRYRICNAIWTGLTTMSFAERLSFSSSIKPMDYSNAF
jgi:hypothetical protein